MGLRRQTTSFYLGLVNLITDTSTIVYELFSLVMMVQWHIGCSGDSVSALIWHIPQVPVFLVALVMKAQCNIEALYWYMISRSDIYLY